MSGSTNCFNELSNYPGSSKLRITSGISEDGRGERNAEMNGDTKNGSVDGYLPNNNVCEDVVSSYCAGGGETFASRTGEIRSCDDGVGGEMDNREESDSWSVNPSEDTNSMNDGSTTDSQLAEATPSDLPCSMPQQAEHYRQQPEPPVDQYEYDEEDDVEQNNGAVRKSSKKKKISSGPGRGRPRKALVAMYHSQISGDKNTIKIRIKKSNFSTQVQVPPTKKKSGRRKKHKTNSDNELSDYERKPTKKSKASVGGDNDVSSTQDHEPLEQSPWGDKIPENVLERIFHHVCAQDGCLPTLIRLCKVCRLWRDVSLRPSLWRRADLNYVREAQRTDLRMHWLLLNRLTRCEDLNFGEWKVRDIQAVLEALCEHCPELRGINLSGWKGLNSDNLKYLTNECKKLERLDLSAINFTSAINAQPLVALSQAMNTRLTHLVLAHNKIAGFTQIVNSIATCCPNLQLLDISNIRTFAHNTALLHVEKLQTGCPKLRVLRITNSQIWLAPASVTDQIASPGFPNLEELSMAGPEEDQTTTSRSMDDDGIQRLLKNSTKLRLLDVRGCSRLTDSGLVRVPAWDLEHLFLSTCYITRMQNSGLELIVQKWSHSLLEVDLAWSTATASLDAAVIALAERGSDSKLRTLNLCGSSVSLEPVKAVLMKCPNLHSINLQSCRALPRGIKRLYTGSAVAELRDSLQDKPKTEANETSEIERSPAHPVVSTAGE